MGEKEECIPTIFLLKLPQDIQDLVCTEDNSDGPIKN